MLLTHSFFHFHHQQQTEREQPAHTVDLNLFRLYDGCMWRRMLGGLCGGWKRRRTIKRSSHWEDGVRVGGRLRLYNIFLNNSIQSTSAYDVCVSILGDLVSLEFKLSSFLRDFYLTYNNDKGFNGFLVSLKDHPISLSLTLTLDNPFSPPSFFKHIKDPNNQTK